MCKTIILPVVLNGSETWLLTLSEERRQMFFVNRVLERIFWLKRDEVTREWRRLHNEELYALYCSSNIIWMIKSRRLRRAGNVARMRREEVHTGFWWENVREGGQLEDLGVEGWIILK